MSDKIQFCLAETYKHINRAYEEIHHLRQENSRLRSLMVRIYNIGYHAGHHDTVEAGYVDIHDCDMDTYNADTVEDILSNTPSEPSGQR